VSYDPEAAGRVRQLLAGRDDVVEKRMVGGLSFLVNGNMCCGITGMALMVRVGVESREQALREPHTRPLQFAGPAQGPYEGLRSALYVPSLALPAAEAGVPALGRHGYPLIRAYGRRCHRARLAVRTAGLAGWPALR